MTYQLIRIQGIGGLTTYPVVSTDLADSKVDAILPMLNLLLGSSAIVALTLVTDYKAS